MTPRALHRIIFAAVLTGWLAWPIGAAAQVPNMGNYTTTPPFTRDVLKPNILLIMDNSASLAKFGPACPSGVCTDFVSTQTYAGMFLSLTCYTYDGGADGRFEPTTTKATVSTACSSTEWDGNFLNWALFRRIDAVKKAMIGGICVVGRAADGTCPPNGTPSLVTLMSQELIYHPTLDRQIETTNAKVACGTMSGRVPTAVTTGCPLGGLVFQLVGQAGPLQGMFCVDDDLTDEPVSQATCADGDGYAEKGPFKNRVGYTIEPTGVIQDVGDRARFGMMVMACTPLPLPCTAGPGTGGAKVLTPIGSRQSVNRGDNTVETFNTNKAAMIDSAEENLNLYGTPIAEALYEGMRYVAQVQQTWLTSQYAYPIAFAGGGSNGVAFGTVGVGGISAGEQTVLTGSETCPAGYIGGGGAAATCAAGRDPFFYGSNHTPAWASPSAQVACCKTYIIVFTDGLGDFDNDVPAALTDFAHPYHGTHCTGANPVGEITSNPTLCSIGTDSNGAGLTYAEYMGQHKTDSGTPNRHYMDDVAYWGHITDLRASEVRAIRPGSPPTDLGAIIPAGQGHDLPGRQTVTTYAFLAFGEMKSREPLMTMAKLGAFEDNGCDRTSAATAWATGCDVANSTTEWDQVDNYTGATGGDGLPDAYFESSNVDDLQDRLQAAIASILKRAGSGTNASVVASSTNAEGAVYQAYFYPGTINEPTFTEVRWVGYLQALWLDAYGNLREDTTQDGKLVLQNDYIVKTQFVYDVNNDNYNEVLVYRYADANGDGKADSATPVDASPLKLKDLKTIWEAGNRLATATPGASCGVNGGGQSCRRILTWWDTDEDGLVDAGEDFEFTAANFASKGIPIGTGVAPFTTANIVDFIRGNQPAGLRDRQLTVGGSLKVWKLGDIVHSSPTLVGPPRERYDVIYGDASYTAYYTTWKTRRQMIYAGGNDGMLHAFNAGYYHRGDDTSTGGVTEHGWFTRTPTDNSGGPLLGDEKWGFVPYQLIPQLYFLTRPDYNHVYYVDLKPKVTDARLFCDGGGSAPAGCVTGQASTSHPNGWGTILIGGMRLGGSCGSCVVGTGAPTMTLTQDFNGDGDTVDAGDTRTFLTAYFVLDITNPEQDPKLLWSFTDTGLGLSTGVPAVVRANPSGDPKTGYANAKWFMVVGSGATTYDWDANQASTSYVMDLMAGPGANNSLVTTYPSSGPDAPVSMGDYMAYDKDLDYRVDVLYMGRNKYTGVTPLWKGYLMRMTTNGGNTNPATWGNSHTGNRVPTVLLRYFPSGGSTPAGGIYAAPAVTTDDARNVWVIFGTGRYYTPWDKVNTETQYLIGIKDPVMTGACADVADSYVNCMQDDLVNVSSATVCVVCAGNQVNGVAGVTSLLGTATSTLQGLIQSKQGWYTTLPAARERVLVTPTIYGGIVFLPSFIPINDVCSGLGSSNLYALFYQTGSAYKESVVGTYDGGGGNTNVSRSLSLGDVGMWSQMSVHTGAQGTGATGASNTGGGCQSGVTGITQSSSFQTNQLCLKPALSSWSRYLSWVDQKY